MTEETREHTTCCLTSEGEKMLDICALGKSDHVRLIYWNALKILSSGMDEVQIMDAMDLDFQKAFNQIPHKQFVNELRAYGVGGGGVGDALVCIELGNT